MRKINYSDPQINQRLSCLGFSLIEVLVALVILAVGVLGVTALQFKALKYSNDANLRSQISLLAYDIADRMRINRSNITNYAGSNYSVDINNPSAACSNTTGADMTNDLLCWHNTIDAVLPHGSTANITVVGNLMSVSLGWTDREGQTHTIEYSFQ